MSNAVVSCTVGDHESPLRGESVDEIGMKPSIDRPLLPNTLAALLLAKCPLGLISSTDSLS